jgi:hypothetical protein
MFFGKNKSGKIKVSVWIGEYQREVFPVADEPLSAARPTDKI